MRRVTKQRQVILKIMAQQQGPLTIEAILVAAREKIPHLHLSTLYRNIKTLCQEGVVTRVELPGEKMRYEKHETSQRHHFLCTLCDQLFPIPTCSKTLQEMVPNGFMLKSHAIVLNGLYKKCLPTLCKKSNYKL